MAKVKPITGMYLNIFDKKYEVLNYNIRFYQDHNPKNGNPSDRPMANTLYIEIISDRGNDFIQWMIEHDQEYDGALEFVVGEKLVKTIKFSGSFLVGYNQNPAFGSNKDITEDLTISYQAIEFDSDVKFEVNAEA